jgi:hypothetical protein
MFEDRHRSRVVPPKKRGESHSVALLSRPHVHRHRRPARRDPRRIRTPANELLLRVVPLVRPGARGRVRNARVPDSRMLEARGIRALRQDAETAPRRESLKRTVEPRSSGPPLEDICELVQIMQ